MQHPRVLSLAAIIEKEAVVSEMKTISVKVQSDHLERIASTTNPLNSISELIWNSLDADANEVKVDIPITDINFYLFISKIII